MDRSKWEYKNLEVDNLPIGDVFDIFMGRTPSRDDLSLWKDGNHEWVSIGDMGTAKYISDTKEKVSDKACSNMRLVPKDTVIMSFKLSIGKVAITEIPLYTNEAIMAFPPKPGYNISPNYLYYHLQAYKWQSANRAVMGKTLNKAVISSSHITIPDSETQQRIVAELDCLNEMIALKQEQLKEFDKLAQSIFYDMFGDPLINDKEWEKFSLSKIGIVTTGNTPSRKVEDYYNKEYVEWIKTDNIDKASLYPSQAKEYLSESGARVGRIVEAGSLLVTCIAGSLSSIGGVCITDRKVAFNQQINAITPNKNVNYIFLYHLIKNSGSFIRENATNGMKHIITKSTFEKLHFPLPPLALQQQFAEKIQAIEAQKELVKQSIAETQQLLDSRMDYYFD